MKHKYILLFILLVPFVLQVSGQTDTAFWFAGPNIQNGLGGAGGQDRPIVMRFTTYALPAIVTVSQPAGGMTPQVISIPANSTQSVNLTNWISIIENTPANTVLNYGLKVKATAPITAYYDVVSNGGGCYCNPEIFTLKGKNALGTDFWIPGQDFANNHTGYLPFTANTFDIIATQDNTTVTITPSNDIVGHTAGTTFTVVLNTGQTYSAAGTSQTATQHLMGSRVTSDKPIAINVVDDVLEGMNFACQICADLAGDQIIPSNNVGSEYIAIKGQLTAPARDQVFITATQNGTTITQDGTVIGTINAGQTQRLPMGAGISTYIQTSQPTYAYQLTGIGGELGSALLPTVACNGSTSVSFTNASNGSLYINLLVQQAGIGTFLVNGVAGVVLPSQFQVVPGTANKWYAAHISLSTTAYPQGTVISVTNNSATFQLGMLNGTNGEGANFGYFSDYGKSTSATAATTTPSICEGAYIFLYVDTVLPGYTWVGPNGFTSSSPNPIINNATPADSGIYVLTLNGVSCGSGDSVLVKVHAAPKVNIAADKDTLCIGDKVVLSVSGANTYTWAATKTLSDTIIAQTQIQDQPDITTTYFVTGTDTSLCVNKDSIIVTVKPYSLPPVANDVSYCHGTQADALTANGLNLLWYTDSTGGSGAFVAPVPSTENEGTTIFYVSQISYNKNTGLYNCESKRAPAKVIVHDNPVSAIAVNKSSICVGDSILLSVQNAVPTNRYQWSPIDFFSNSTDTTTWIGSVSPGNVYLTTINTFNCLRRDSLFIDAQPCCIVSFPNAFTPNGDGKNDVFRPITAGHHQIHNFMVVNRWGKVIFETAESNDSWDGTFNGNPQDIGVYYYYIEYECSGKAMQEKGSVTLIR